MIESEKVNKILYGGDYNPEQWPEEVWAQDMRLLKEAHIDIVTLNVFSWALLQPSEDVYDFSMLDKIMELVRENGMKVCLATSTAAHPAWMARKYPDILRTEKNGMKRKFGSRHNSCPNSKSYRHFAALLVEKLAERYKNYENIVGWHISNEFGGECYCENCERKFREWVKEKYGTIENVNKAWNMNFWSHTLYDFDDIVTPDLRSEEFEWDGLRTNFQGISLDYARFNSDSILECFNLEKDIIKKYTPNIPVTTNLMGMYKCLDYQKWAKDMDFISWDNYPAYNARPYEPALSHDLMRGLKQGKPFALMEQTASVSNWHLYCKQKRPGVMRLLSYQAVAHGADAVMFFQMRRSIGACEKYHGAIIDHAGTSNTRVFREVTKLGEELELIHNATLGGRTDSKVCIVFDWDNWWAADLSAGPSRSLYYVNQIRTYYYALWRHNISVDFVSVTDNLSKYSLVIAPMLYMCKKGFDTKVREYVKAGGAFMTTTFSGYVDDNDLVVLGGYPGKLRDILGVWVEELDALPPDEQNHFIYKGKEYPAMILCDVMHAEGAETEACFKADYYADYPAITKNKYGKGTAYYVGTISDDNFYSDYLLEICAEYGIKPVIECDEEVEVTERSNEKGSYIFVLNHSEAEKQIKTPDLMTDILSGKEYKAGEKITLNAKDVMILKRCI